MESLGVLMMVTALSWPIVGGAIVGLVGGLLRGHGVVGTIADVIIGGVLGYGLFMGASLLMQNASLPEMVSLGLSIGLPVLGGLIGLGFGGRFARA